ncbi:hypothetical protein PPROV_000668000 [Pycnococcus provasolii]|uniref:Uncharacterized protein n=1 Tax=Pycnococcus provasolii TaxID=41880 RepID=A0A830HM31_9CHLO|nr:hypothetical protein PPROV_000668000 [Pycnococcus provasolii]
MAVWWRSGAVMETALCFSPADKQMIHGEITGKFGFASMKHFTEELKLRFMLRPMPNEQKICEYIQYTCTCHGKLGIKHKFGFQCTRKCKHVLARALRDGLFTVPPDMKLGVVAKPKSAGGRAKRAGKALEPESSESEEEDDGFSECSSDDSGEDDIE